MGISSVLSVDRHLFLSCHMVRNAISRRSISSNQSSYRCCMCTTLGQLTVTEFRAWTTYYMIRVEVEQGKNRPYKNTNL